MAVTVEPVFPPQVLTWEELPLLTVEAELPHWEGRRAFCRYYAAWGRGLLDYGRRVLLPQLAERCRRALEQGGMLPVTTPAGEPSQRGIRGGVFALRPGAGAAGSTWAVMGR